jgi:hypothetical protein
MASDSYLVEEVIVLAATGFDVKEFSMILLSLFAVSGSVIFLRRKLIA